MIGNCKSHNLFCKDKNAGRGDRVAEAGTHSMRHGIYFDWIGGHSAKQVAPRLVRGAHGLIV